MKGCPDFLKNWFWRALGHAIVNDGVRVDGPTLNIYSLRKAVGNLVELIGANTSTAAATMAAGDMLNGIVNFTGTLSGGTAMTVPAIADILAALEQQTPVDGLWGKIIRIVNNGTGQTITVTGGGTTGCTISGTATVANNTWREFALVITSPTTYTMTNIGGGNL